MLGRKKREKKLYYNINIERKVPKNHILRKIEKLIDWDYLWQLAKKENRYSSIGQPSIDPIVHVKMLLIGYLYNIPSHRRIAEDCSLNIAYLWFLGYDIDEEIPNHSSISQARRRGHFTDSFKHKVFIYILKLCAEAGLISGEAVIDSTHIKAKASKDSTSTIVINPDFDGYFNQLEEESNEKEPDEDSSGSQETSESAPDEKKDESKKKVKTKTVKIVDESLHSKELKYERKKVNNGTSRNDPDCGMLDRPGKPKGPHYLEHIVADANSGVILGLQTTPGNANDSAECIPTIDKTQKNLIEANAPMISKLGADRGYDTVNVHQDLEIREIEAYIAERKHKSTARGFSRKKFIFDSNRDLFVCPNNKELPYKNTVRKREGVYQRVYKSFAKDCKHCKLKDKCLGKIKGKSKILCRYEGIEIKERAHERNKINRKEYRRMQRKRKTVIEGINGEAKEQHGLDKAKMQGKEKVHEQAIFTAIIINIKRILKAKKNKPMRTVANTIKPEFHHNIRILSLNIFATSINHNSVIKVTNQMKNRKFRLMNNINNL